MFITITGKNFNPSDKLEATVEKKFAKLDKYFSKEAKAAIMCSEVKTGLCKMEATIYAAGMIFRAEESSNDIYYCLDKVIDKLSTQMSRFKTKLVRRHKEQKDIIFEEIPDAAPTAVEEEKGIVRTKRFRLNPMSSEEAILQMELLEHNFFIYKDGESGGINVVYKREDGSYGLLETEE
ncbi:MAG: ribosome-associated translation inhibitor RaiA [Clostridia bacterium]|jgi:putative sigma-54 modulation protein|nr:ribosome-associated translation inhibitor RaiA [Clostridia bacterium]